MEWVDRILGRMPEKTTVQDLARGFALTVFAVRRHDEDDHEALAQAVDAVLGEQPSIGGALKELRRLRNEMDYSPYPGPSPQSQYDAQEIEEAIATSVEQAERVVRDLERHLQDRR